MKLYFKALSVGMILVATHNIANASTVLSDIFPKASRMLRSIKSFSAASLSDAPVYIQKRNLHSTLPVLDIGGATIGKNVPCEQWEKIAEYPATSTTQKTKKIPQSKADNREPVLTLPLILKDVLMGGESVTERVSSTPAIYQPKDKPVTPALVIPTAQEAHTINFYKTAGC